MGSPYDFKFKLRSSEEIRTFVMDIVKQLGHEIEYDAMHGPVSDNVHFQSKGVPSVWLKGERSIFIHTAKDDPETLDYDKLKLLSDINGEVIYRIATQKQLPF